ncbi:MAG: hypothetical protein D8H95_10690 [Lachnospiraceae bacterium]|nr:MAG: hypothetical protein D8H95_10690 [Lachnospiraceae bacterium]
MIKKKYIKSIQFIISFSLIIAGLSQASLRSLAKSPTFSRTEEEWAKLRDMNLDYEEIDGLVTEYNATVQTNQANMQQFTRDYGRKNSQVSQSYRDMAEKIEDSLTEPEPDSMTYVPMMASIAQSRATINNLKNSADTTLEDYEVQYFTYESARLSLVQNTKALMISYYSKDVSKEALQKAVEVAELNLANAQARVAVGMATNLDVLSAKEAVIKANKTLSDQSNAALADRDKLLIMTGFKTDSQANIGLVPVLSEEELQNIDKINVEEDIKKAVEENYALKINKRKLGNAKSDTQIKSLNSTISSGTENIKANVQTLHKNLVNAKDKLNLLKAELELSSKDLETIRQKKNLGMATQLEVANKELENIKKNTEKKQAELALRLALENYNSAVNGLASVGQ